MFTEHGAGRFTSQGVLDAETRLVNATRTPTAAGSPGPRAAAALDGFEAVSGTSLDAGQRDLVTAFACDSRLLLAGIGPAGSGQDDRDARPRLRAARGRAAARSRWLPPPRRRTCSAGSSACGRRTCTSSCTSGPPGRSPLGCARGPGCRSRPGCSGSHPGDVVLVDEAGMAGTFLLDRLVRLAAARGAVVRLLGRRPAAPGRRRRRRAAAGRRPAGHAAADGAVPVPRPRRGRRDAAAPGRGRRRGRLVRRRRAGPVRVPRGDGRRPPTPGGRTTCSPGRSP